MDEMSDHSAPESLSELRKVIGEPLPIVRNKEQTRLDGYFRRFIELSPFLVIASVGADGHVDVSPRGDPPGFVKIVDDTTILLPDRPGNRRVDTMGNLLENPSVGLIFLMPGYEETVRVRGRASLTSDPALLDGTEVNGKAPKLGILIAIDRVFFHCAKALKRSRLWDPDAQIQPGDYPRFAQIIRDQRMPDESVEKIDAVIQDNYKNELY